MSIQDDVLLNWYDTVVELFELDLTPITTGVTTNKFYFTNQMHPASSGSPGGTKIQWKATGSGTALVTYEPIPIAVEGFERNTDGKIAEPTIMVANIFGTFTEAVGELDDLVGAKLVRRRTLGKYLGGMPGQDLNAEFPTDIYYIERKVAESNQYVKFQLASPMDLEGLQLPKRVITQNYCVWKYRGAECGYAGPPVAGIDDRAPVPSGAAAADPAVVAYLAAVSGYQIALRDYRTAAAAASIASNRQVAACSGSGTTIEDTEANFGAALGDLTFAFCSGTTDLMVYWRGAPKDAGDPYRGSASRRVYGTYPTSSMGNRIFAITRQASATGATTSHFRMDNRGTASFVLQTDGYPGTGGPQIGIYNGSIVTLSGSGYPRYEAGSARSETGVVRFVEKLSADSTACDRATSGETAAIGARNSAQAALTTASGALAAATAALPSGSALFAADICGKRLSSCRLRFPGQELPFGGFPGANIGRD